MVFCFFPCQPLHLLLWVGGPSVETAIHPSNPSIVEHRYVSLNPLNALATQTFSMPTGCPGEQHRREARNPAAALRPPASSVGVLLPGDQALVCVLPRQGRFVEMSGAGAPGRPRHMRLCVCASMWVAGASRPVGVGCGVAYKELQECNQQYPEISDARQCERPARSRTTSRFPNAAGRAGESSLPPHIGYVVRCT